MRIRESYIKFMKSPLGLPLTVLAGGLVLFGAISYPIATWLERDHNERLESVRGTFETQTQRIFEQYDQDRSGFLNKEETERMYGQELADKITRKFDYNKNGVLDGMEPAFATIYSDAHSLPWKDFSQLWGENAQNFGDWSGDYEWLSDDYKKILGEKNDKKK